MKRLLPLLAVLLLATPLHAADYWLCMDAQGQKTAQDHPCADDAVQVQPRNAPAVAASPMAQTRSASEPTPLLPAMPDVDPAALKPYLRQGVLALLALVGVMLAWRGLRRALQAWDEREPKPRKPTAPERIEPSEDLRRHSKD